MGLLVFQSIYLLVLRMDDVILLTYLQAQPLSRHFNGVHSFVMGFLYQLLQLFFLLFRHVTSVYIFE